MALLDKEDIKIELGIDTEGNIDRDDLLDALISSVVKVFEEISGRMLEEDTFTEYYSGDKGQNKILLRNYPILSITSIHDDPDWAYGSSSLLSASDYTFNADKGMVYYNGAFYDSANNIKVIYVAGYGGEAGNSIALPTSVKQTITRQIAHWYDQSKNKIWAVSSAIDPTGGSRYQSYSQLKDNMLPDFVFMANNYRSMR